MTDKPNDLGTALGELGAAFGEMLETVTLTVAASAAMAAALDGDRDRLAHVLDDLTPAQLRDILTAAGMIRDEITRRTGEPADEADVLAGLTDPTDPTEGTAA